MSDGVISQHSFTTKKPHQPSNAAMYQWDTPAACLWLCEEKKKREVTV